LFLARWVLLLDASSCCLVLLLIAPAGCGQDLTSGFRAANPRSARLSEALGREYLEQAQLDQALRACQQAAERGPTLPGIHLALAKIHADAGRWEETVREVDRELAMVPDSAAAVAVKARIIAARPG